RRIHKVTSAGSTPIRYIHRQALGPTPADRQPDAGGEDAAEPGAALQQPATFAACVVRPQLGDDRRSGRPFRTVGACSPLSGEYTLALRLDDTRDVTRMISMA